MLGLKKGWLGPGQRSSVSIAIISMISQNRFLYDYYSKKAKWDRAMKETGAESLVSLYF